MGSRILHSAGARLGEHMVTKAQIDRIATRIEALAPKSDRVVYVWRNRGKPKKRCSNGTISRRQLIVSLDKLTSSAG